MPLCKKKSGEQADSADAASPVQLQKKITLMNGVSIIVGSIIGSGFLLVRPHLQGGEQHRGLAASLGLCAASTASSGVQYSRELGTMIQRSGADYAYFLVAFGPFMAFLHHHSPHLCQVHPGAIFHRLPAPIITEKLLAALCLTILTAANCWSIRASTWIQDICTWGKTLALIIIIIAGCVQVGRGKVEFFEEPFADSVMGVGNLVRAFYSGLFAYNGWNYLNCVTGEMKNPQRDLPLAIFISCAIVTVVYVLANAAYFTTVPVAEFVTTPAVAILFAKKISGFLAAVMPIFVSLSTFGGVNGVLLTTSRIFFQRLLTPLPAVLLVGLISLVYLTIDDIYVLVNYMGFVNWLAIGLSVSIVLYLRVKRPNDPRPVRVPIIFPIVYTMFTVLLCANAFIGAFWECAMGVVIILTAVPVYLIGVAWTNKPKSLLRWTSDLTRLVQKVFLVQLQEDGEAKSEAEKLRLMASQAQRLLSLLKVQQLSEKDCSDLAEILMSLAEAAGAPGPPGLRVVRVVMETLEQRQQSASRTLADKPLASALTNVHAGAPCLIRLFTYLGALPVAMATRRVCLSSALTGCLAAGSDSATCGRQRRRPRLLPRCFSHIDNWSHCRSEPRCGDRVKR
uniref:AA_permease_C domain-containing protein n=1 Tax=Macrostomum lignano TaxID=282301 RepID=A0A1I8F8Q0_9PLAT